MFRTKKDVDRHVQEILSKIHNENEKSLRGYSFARFYYQIKEYEAAKRYLANYLGVREHHAPAHKLLGQAHEALGNKEKAVQSYKRSLELDANQKDLVLKICELYCHIPVDRETAMYWIERGDKVSPHNSTVFRLRERIVSGGNGSADPNKQEMEKLLESELVAQPYNVSLRIKLLRLYLDTERVKDAFEQGVKIESKCLFPNSIEWYRTLIEAFEAYSERNGQELDSNFYVMYLSALDRLVTLTLSEPHLFRQRKEQETPEDIPTIIDATGALLEFDQSVKTASEKGLENGAWTYFLDHMKGQLYFHFGSLVLKSARKDQSNIKEARKIAAAFFLVGYSYKPGVLLQESWFSQMDEQQKLYTNFFRLASMRTSFLGHVILSTCKEDRVKWMHNIKQDVCVHQVRDKVYNRLLGKVNKLFDTSKSYLLNDSTFLDGSFEFPMLSSLLEYDRSCYLMCSKSLHHLVWLHLHLEESDSEFAENHLREAFKGLKFSNKNLSKGSPESLCLLDVEAFLLSSLYTTKQYLNLRSSTNTSYDELAFPPDITDSLCTDEQANWWLSAHGLVNNTIKNKLGEHRLSLQRGLEVIRAIGNHGLDPQLVIHLARSFAERASAVPMDLDCSKRRLNDSERLITDKVTSVENRAQFYWNVALGMLTKLEDGISLGVPKNRMFPWYGKSLSKEQISVLKEEGKLFIACRHMHSNNLEEAVQLFDKLMSAEASYYSALSYKKLALQEPASSTARAGFLNRAKNAIYLTMDRISKDPTHPLNEEIHVELEEVEHALQNQLNNANSNNSGNDSEVDELDNTSESSFKNNTKNMGRNQNRVVSHSTPKSSSRFTPNRTKTGREDSRTHLEPSPERLDAQIRALTLMQSSLVKTLMEQQRSLLDTNKAIIEELRQNKEVVVELKKQLEELQISTKKQQQQQQKSVERKMPPARSHTISEDDGFDYDENGILDYYMGAEGMDSYRQGYYGLTHQQQQAMSDVARASLGYVPGAGLPPGPPPPALAPYNYQYPPPPHGLPSAAAAQSPGLVVPPPSQPGSLDVQHYYPMNHGLQFSEGQPLPQFRFHVATPVVKPAVSTVQQIPQVPIPAPGMNVQQTVVTTQVPTAPIQQPVSQWTRNGPVPHAFQIPLPASSTPQSITQPGPATPSAFGSGVLPQTLPPAMHTGLAPATTISSAPQLISDSELKVLLTSPPPLSSSTSNLQSTIRDVTKPSIFGSPHAASGMLGGITVSNITPEANRSRKESETCSDTDIEREVMGDFKPLIPLPDEVVVKTGEEDEEVLFENRAKLFRFIDREWKERGTGVVKILKHAASGKVRLLMRRDQVHKICANHHIVSTMALSPLKDSDRAFTWAAQDFADEQVKLEQFCIRFKNQDIATYFKRSFGEAVDFVKSREAVSEQLSTSKQTDAPGGSASSNVTSTSNVKSSLKPITVGLAKPGTWTCLACYLSNDASKTKCIACESDRPDSINITATGANSSKSTFPQSSTSNSISSGVSNMTGLNFTDKPFAFQTPVVTKNETSTKKAFEGIVPKDSTFKATAIGSPSFSKVDSSSANSSVRTSSVFSNFSFSSSEISTEHDTISKAPPKKSESVLDQTKTKSSSSVFSDTASPFSALDMSQKSSHTPQSVGSSKQVSFGGFTFTSPPVVVQNDADSADRQIAVSVKSKESQEPSKPEATKSSPFSGFSFKTPSLTNSFSSLAERTAIGDAKLDSKTEKSGKHENEHIFGSGSGVSNLDFSALPTSNSAFGSKTTAAADAAFPGTGSPLFVTVTRDGRRVSGESSGNEPTPEEFEPAVDFKPVVPLPPLVEVKTGEEEEEVLFKERAKLFRFEVTTKEWKECGLGDIKILNMLKEKKYRIVMRRDQVLKLCANHYILPEMKLLPLSTNEKAWSWFAQDFSQEEVKHEKFAVKFKAVERAKEFYSVFEKCRKELENRKNQGPDANSAAAINNVHQSDTASGARQFEEKSRTGPCVGLKESLSDMFKPELGSWECPACLIRNAKTKKICEACDTPRPGMAKTPESKSSVSVSQPVVSSALAATSPSTTQSVFGSFRFPSPTTAASAPSSFVFGNKSETSKPFPSGFVFGSSDSSPQSHFQQDSSENIPPTFGFKPEVKTSSTPSVFGSYTFDNVNKMQSSTSVSIKPVITPPTFVFKTPTASTSSSPSSAATKPVSVFSFGSNTTDKTSDGVEFRFGSPQKYEFNFSGVRPHSPTKGPKSPRSPGTPTDAEEEEEVEPSDADGIYFQPVIPLPPKVEIKTGEENEVTLFSRRAKLFRFADKEWKERGIGDIKILFNESQNTYRLLMRRDQVLKVCLNHNISRDINFAWKSDKSLSWAAVDYTENEPSLEQFAVRFKTAELASEFKEAIDSVIPKIQSATSSAEKVSGPTSSSSLSNFSFKLPGTSEASSQSPDRDSVKKCLDFTLDSSTSESKSVKDSSANVQNKFSFFSASEGQSSQLSPFSLSSRLATSPSAKPLGRTSDFFSNLPNTQTQEPDSDVEIIYEAIPSLEDVKLAEKLMLPKNFFSYKNKPPCPGCRGCDENDVRKSKPKEDPVKDAVVVVQEAEKPKEKPVEKPITEETSIFSNTKVSTFSFADLASKSSGFDVLKSTSPLAKHSFPGAGVPVFGNIVASQSNEDDDGEVVQSTDIHFDPVIPLPDVVEVKTGEEDEIVLFSSRGKLYRYETETSQWKERALGDMKILQHKEKCRFRLLMRREQVFKVACNHVIIPSMELKPMNTSETALCWGAIDYSEGHPEQLQLAIRFKMKETLAEFKKIFEDCKAILSSSGQQTVQDNAVSSDGVAASAQNSADSSFGSVGQSVSSSQVRAPDYGADELVTTSVTSTEGASGGTYDADDDDYEDDDEEDEEEEEEDIAFSQQVFFSVYDDSVKDYREIGVGNLQVLYDDRVYGYRILVTGEEGEVMCDHVIAIQTCLRTDQLNATWSAVDISMEPPCRRKFKAKFSSIESLQEFSAIFEDGKNFAVHAEIVEKNVNVVVPAPR